MSIDFDVRTTIPLPAELPKNRATRPAPTTIVEANILAKDGTRNPEVLQDILVDLLIKVNNL